MATYGPLMYGNGQLAPPGTKAPVSPTTGDNFGGAGLISGNAGNFQIDPTTGFPVGQTFQTINDGGLLNTIDSLIKAGAIAGTAAAGGMTAAGMQGDSALSLAQSGLASDAGAGGSLGGASASAGGLADLGAPPPDPGIADPTGSFINPVAEQIPADLGGAPLTIGAGAGAGAASSATSNLIKSLIKAGGSLLGGGSSPVATGGGGALPGGYGGSGGMSGGGGGGSLGAALQGVTSSQSPSARMGIPGSINYQGTDPSMLAMVMREMMGNKGQT